MRYLIRFVLASAAASFVLMAEVVIFAVAELYATGNGGPSLMAWGFDCPELGISVGWVTVLIFVIAILAWVTTWIVSGRVLRR